MPSRVLVAERIAPRGIEALKAAGLDVAERLDLDPDQLLEAVHDAAALIVRSATPVTAEVLAAAPDLVVVGRAGIGLDNVDVAAATRRGVMVVNAPQSNVLSAAEHTIALLLDEAKVAVVPGEAFGAPGYARLTFAVSDQNIEEGVQRIAKLLA